MPALPAMLSLGNGVELLIVTNAAGSFVMGFDGTYRDEKPTRTVTISKPFAMARTPITQKQWKAVMGDNPSHFRGDELPVEMVTWEESQEFCRRLSVKTGSTVSLPTEAEWEYALRAGTDTCYFFGSEKEALGKYAWFDKNAAGHTHPVGQKLPNPWGLYDMLGNVCEWCEDEHLYSYFDAPCDGSARISETDPPPGRHRRRCIRGGAFEWPVLSFRSASRAWSFGNQRNRLIGFRVVVR